jgi:lysophospholipase L1-like esterase
MAEANVEGVCQDPFVRIINPLTNEVQGRPDLTVTASVCLTQAAHAGWGVKFSVDSGAQEQIITLPADGVIHPDTFQWTFAGLSGDNHQIEAFIVDALDMPVAGNNTSDIVTNIGIGDVFAAIGDSLTVGVGDGVNTNGTSQDGRNTNTGLGFIPILNDILTNERGYPHNIHNDGISGDSSAGVLVRAPKILKSRKKTSAFLILIGSNDANSGLVPSGKNGSNPPGPGTFKDNLQQIIDLLHNPAQGREVYLAKVPYTTRAASDPFILDYNIAIEELVTENSLPECVPDFYTHFQTKPTELNSDGLHPTGDGYKSMASLWCIEVSGGTCPIP